MSSNDVAKTVAKKLKYYLDVKRREDGFDLSGPYLPKGDPLPLRAGPTLAYDGIHDRSLKHYFHNNTVKKQLQHMTVPSTMHRRREMALRRFVDETMASVDYRLKPGPISPYAFPQTFKPMPPPHRPKALRTVDEYLKTKRGSRRRKIPTNIVGKPRRIARRSPPQHVHKDERERIVNMASKLIVATETVALPQQKKQSKGFQTSEKELPRLERRSSKSAESSTESAFTSGHESEGSINGRPPYPPKREKPSSASRRRRPQSSFFKSSSFDNPRAASGVHVVLPGDSSSENDKIRYLMDRMNLDGRGTSIVASPRDFNRPKSAVYPLKSTATTGVETDLPDYSDDDFCSDEDSPKASARTPRVTAWSGNEDNDMVDMCTQTVVHSGTQTKFPEVEEMQQEREVILPKSLSWADKTDDVTPRPPVAVATTGASTADVLTSTSHETQTRNRDLEPKVITYEVYVQTGDRLGAGSKVNVKITLFGEYGNSGERQLLRSKTHRNKFQRGQVDVFAVDSLFLGKLQSIRIGHNETRLGYGWFLDKVYIKEGAEATRSFEFRCNRWLSSRDDDGQIMRDLPLYDVVPASHVDAILPREQARDEFYSPGDGDTTQTESEESPRETEPQTHDSARKKAKKKTPTKTKTQVKEKSEILDDVDGFKGTKAENLFDVSDEEDEEEGRFFEPEDDYESEGSDDEDIVDRKETKAESKPPRFKNAARTARKEKKKEQESNEEEQLSDESKKKKKQPPRFSHVKTAIQATKKDRKEEEDNEENEEKERDSDEQKRDKKQKLSNVKAVMRAARREKKEQPKVQENDEVDEDEEESENEEEKEEKEEQQNEELEEEKEEAPPQKVPKGASHLRVITTALSPFLKNRSQAHPPHNQPSPIPEEPPELPDEEPTKKEKPRSKTEDSDDEPAVEFPKPEEKKAERPSSGKSQDFDEGLRAGIRKKAEEDRKRHRASITESESVLKSGETIHDAAKAGNLPRIKELIQVVPAMKSTQNEKGMTPLHIASSNGHLDCVKWLAVSGVDLADETPTGYTAMHLAAMNGHVNCMMILAAMGHAIGCKTVDSFTPLHLAAMSGHIECVKWLLANRAQADIEDMNGRTPLDIAEEYGHEAIQKLLQKFKKELKRQDSTLAQLMTAEKRRKSVDSTSDNDAAPSKVSDSGVGGMESEEDNWISDAEEDVGDDIKPAPADQSSNRKASTSSRDRPDSASRSRTDSIVTAEEKKKMFEEQRRKMKKRHSSFLDSIRMDVENEEEF